MWSGLVRGGRPPPLSSSEGGRATTQHARSLFVSIIARGTTHCATTLTTRNATRMCKIYVGLPPRTVREPVRPRVTEQCVSSSLHSASRGVARDARQCERQCGLRNPKPIRRLDFPPSIVTKKRPKAVRFGQCEPLPLLPGKFLKEFKSAGDTRHKHEQYCTA